MARPKKAQTLDHRVSIRVSEQTFKAYARIAAAFDVPVGQLLRQILTLEVAELELIVSALQHQAHGERFAPVPTPLNLAQQEAITRARSGMPLAGSGFTDRLREEAMRQQGVARPGLVQSPDFFPEDR